MATRPRRAPSADERGRAAEQTREAILRAALAEFGAKGYAGARTASIAERAGVNQQLISYYFGGKQGVLDELRARWRAQEAERAGQPSSFAESVTTYLDVVADNPDWARLVVWNALGSDAGAPDEQLGQGLRAAVERMALRQRDGEVTSAVDPAFLLLLSYALTFAPIALPQHVRGIVDRDPASPEFREWSVEQLLRLVTP